MTQIGETFTPSADVEHKDSNGRVISRYLAGETYRVTPRNFEFVRQVQGDAPAPKGAAVEASPGKLKATVSVEPKKEST